MDSRESRDVLFSPLAFSSLWLSQTVTYEGMYNKDGAIPEFREGTRVLHDFLDSLSNKKKCEYELWDLTFASNKPKRFDASRLWPAPA